MKRFYPQRGRKLVLAVLWLGAGLLAGWSGSAVYAGTALPLTSFAPADQTATRGLDLSSFGQLLGNLDLETLLGSGSSASSGSSSSASGLDTVLELLGVSGRKIRDCKVNPIPDQKYTGKELRPAVTVTYNGTKLKRGTDYSLTYKENVKTGTAKAVITGKGNYSGQKTVSFKITRSGASTSKTKTKTTRLTVKLGQTSYTYTGSEKKPTVKVTSSGKSLTKSQYTVTYKNNKNVGLATVTVRGKGDYKGREGEASFKILLKKTSLSSASSPAEGELKAAFKADPQADGYQVQVCTNKTFKSAVKKQNLTGSKTTTAAFTGLTGKKKYYVRIRSYKKVGSSNWYSTWSAAKEVNVK